MKRVTFFTYSNMCVIIVGTDNQQNDNTPFSEISLPINISYSELFICTMRAAEKGLNHLFLITESVSESRAKRFRPSFLLHRQ